MNQIHPPRETLIDYLHRELDPQADAAILAHIEGCEDCRRAYETEARLSDSLRRYAAVSERELPAGVVATIWDRIESAKAPPWWERLSAFARPVVAVPVAAAILIGGYLGFQSLHPGSPATTIDAAYYLDDHAAMTSTVPFSEGTVVPASLENEETGADQRWVESTGPSDVAADATN